MRKVYIEKYSSPVCILFWMMMSESGSSVQMQRGIVYINADTFDNNKW